MGWEPLHVVLPFRTKNNGGSSKRGSRDFRTNCNIDYRIVNLFFFLLKKTNTLIYKPIKERQNVKIY